MASARLGCSGKCVDEKSSEVKRIMKDRMCINIKNWPCLIRYA